MPHPDPTDPRDRYTQGLDERCDDLEAELAEARKPRPLDKILVLDSAGRQITVKDLLAEGQAAIGRLAKLERWLTDENPSIAIYRRYGHIAVEDDCMNEIGRGETITAAIDAIEEEENDAE